MAHTLLSPTIILKELMRLYKNNLVMGANVYRDLEAQFPGSPKKGGSVLVRLPVKFTVTKARTRVTSDITEQSITMTVATQAHISWQFTMKDLTLTIEDYSSRYLRNAAAALANTVDADLTALYSDLYNTVYESTGFVTPTTFMVLGKAMQRLDEEAAPGDDRVVVFNPAAHWGMANTLTSLYVEKTAEGALRKGYLGRIANGEIFMDQNIKVHQTGCWGGSGAQASTDATGKEVATGAPTGASVLGTTAIAICDFDYINSYALRDGDIFTIAGVYAVNPMSGESTGSLRQFVVTADVTCGSTGTTTEAPVTVYISPNMIHTGPYKTVNSLPSGGAVVDILGLAAHKYPQNLCFHKNAFALVMVPLEKPQGVWGDTISDDGYSMSIVKDFNIDTHEEICRVDILYGVKTLFPELGIRVMGQETGT